MPRRIDSADYFVQEFLEEIDSHTVQLKTGRSLRNNQGQEMAPVLRSRIGTDFTLANVITAQNLFPAGQASVLLTPGIYRFLAMGRITAGAVSSSISWVFGGSAALDNVSGLSISVVAGGSGSIQQSWMNNVEAATATVITTAGTASMKRFQLEGEFRVVTEGLLTPQIQFNADPTGTILAKVGTFFECQRIGDGSLVSTGVWS